MLKYSGPKHQLNDKNNEYLSGCIFPVPITVIPRRCKEGRFRALNISYLYLNPMEIY